MSHDPFRDERCLHDRYIVSLQASARILFWGCLAGFRVVAQQTDSESLKKSAVKVFVHYNYCDLDFIRAEVTFANYVRDRKDAQVGEMITQQSTGIGGTEYTLRYIAQEQFKGIDNQLRYVSGTVDTAAEIRSSLAGILNLGLASYAGRTPMASKLSVIFQEKAKPTSVEDRWNFWAFSICGRQPERISSFGLRALELMCS